MTDLPDRKILHVVGNLNRWAIQLRAEYLAAKMPKRYAGRVVGYRQIPDSPDGLDVVHFHTPCNLHEVLARRPAYLDHPCWGFEVISCRRDDYLERAHDVTIRAKFCVAKNPRLADWVRPYLSDGVEAVYIPNGVDERLFFPGPLRVGWCGNKRPESADHKGVAYVEAAVGQLTREYAPAVGVEFVTDPGDAPGRILDQTEIAPWYRTLAVYVSASKSEGCSNTILEALASGVPVVTTDTGIAPELAAMCDLAIVERSTEGVAAGIRKFLDPIVRRRRLIFATYRWKLIAQRYADLYEELLTCAPTPTDKQGVLA